MSISAPKVSIIVPAYNVAEYVEECLDSIVGQTMRDLEIICVNDGSTDDTLDILQKYASADPRVIIIDKENEGYGVAMNIGLDRATGEYIGIVEPDDYIKHNMFETLYNAAKENDLDFVKADFYRFKRRENGNMLMRYIHLSDNADDYNKVFNPSESPETLRYVMNTWSGIYKRNFIEQHNIRHNTTPGAAFQDNGFWFQTFALAKRAMILDKPFYLNRRDNPNSSVKDPAKVYAMNREYDFIKGLLAQDRDLWERFKGMFWVYRLINYQTTVRRISESMRSEYAKRCQKEFKQAFRRGEIVRECFTDEEWSDVQKLLNDPSAFVAASLKPKKVSAERELANIKKSSSYRIGRTITAIPRKLKNLAKKASSKKS